jgi:hypothetical protein
MVFGASSGQANGFSQVNADRLNPNFVIPAKAGTQGEFAPRPLWIPAFAGMTKQE